MKLISTLGPFTEQKRKFSIKGFFFKFDQIRRNLRIWSHLLKKSLMEKFIFCAVVSMLLFVKCFALYHDYKFDWFTAIEKGGRSDLQNL